MEKLSFRTSDIGKISQKLGAQFHEEWRNTRLQSDGKYEPRIEKTTDKTWILQHNGNAEVDIANTKFEDLPSDRKYENLEAAKVAVGLVFDKVLDGVKITPEMIEEMSEIIHNKWLERNGVAGSFEYQRVEYQQLSEEEKSKDRNHLLQAIEIVKKYSE